MVTKATIEKLISDLGDCDTAICQEAKQSLLNLGSHAVDPLLVTLTSKNIRQCCNAIILLGELGFVRASPSLLEMRLHTHPLVRINVAHALGKLGGRSIVEYLVQWLQTEQEILVQMEVLLAIGNLDQVKASQYLIKVLEETESSTLRYMIIFQLGEIGEKRAINAILPYIKDDDIHVQEHSSMALRKLGYHRKTPEVQNVFDTTSNSSG